MYSFMMVIQGVWIIWNFKTYCIIDFFKKYGENFKDKKILDQSNLSLNISEVYREHYHVMHYNINERY